MFVQADVETMEERHRADGKTCFVYIRSTETVGLQAWRNDPKRVGSTMFNTTKSRLRLDQLR